MSRTSGREEKGRAACRHHLPQIVLTLVPCGSELLTVESAGYGEEPGAATSHHMTESRAEHCRKHQALLRRCPRELVMSKYQAASPAILLRDVCDATNGETVRRLLTTGERDRDRESLPSSLPRVGRSTSAVDGAVTAQRVLTMCRVTHMAVI